MVHLRCECHGRAPLDGPAPPLVESARGKLFTAGSRKVKFVIFPYSPEACAKMVGEAEYNAAKIKATRNKERRLAGKGPLLVKAQVAQCASHAELMRENGGQLFKQFPHRKASTRALEWQQRVQRMALNPPGSRSSGPPGGFAYMDRSAAGGQAAGQPPPTPPTAAAGGQVPKLRGSAHYLRKCAVLSTGNNRYRSHGRTWLMGPYMMKSFMTDWRCQCCQCVVTTFQTPD